MKIYACYHKNYATAKSDVLTPIQVAKNITNISLPFISDNTQENIAEKNPYYCELTTTYWIWKNAKEKIVGLCHYRRYFNFKNNHTKINKINDDFAQWSGNTKENILSLFNEYDIILPQKKGAKKTPETLYSYYKRKHVIEDLDTTLKVIKEKYPDQYQTAYNVIHNQTTGYYANMIVTKKEIFDTYAKWLFSILFEVEKCIQKNVENRDTYQKRVYGFLSERLMTVFIALNPTLKVKEVPLIFIEENKEEYLKYLFRYMKRKLLHPFKRKKNG